MSRPITVQVGPLAAASATKAALSQTAVASQYLVLNGAAGTFTANNICLSQSPAGAGLLTLNGSLASTRQPIGFNGSAAAGATIAYLDVPSRIYFTSAGNDSGVTLTIVGTLQSATTFGPGIGQSEVVTGANASTVSSSNVYSQILSITISGASAGTVTVGTYGPATFDTARQVIITSGGNDTGITFAITGTDWAGNAIGETPTGANGAAATSVLSYRSITSIKSSAAVATTVTVGTNGVASSPWAVFDELASFGPVSIQCTVSGTANGSVQQTLQDPNSTSNPIAPALMAWANHPDSNLVNFSTTVQGNYAYQPKYARVVLNSETGTGSISAIFTQAFLR